MFRRVIEHYTKSKNPKSVRYKWDMAKRICGHHVKYVSERIDNVDEVIGKIHRVLKNVNQLLADLCNRLDNLEHTHVCYLPF